MKSIVFLYKNSLEYYAEIYFPSLALPASPKNRFCILKNISRLSVLTHNLYYIPIIHFLYKMFINQDI